jgi:hypothetical protein
MMFGEKDIGVIKLFRNAEELASELVLAYGKEPWGNVEDDVGLCVWVRKFGVELTLGEAAKLRVELEARKPKFYIVVAARCDARSKLIGPYISAEDRDQAASQVWMNGSSTDILLSLNIESGHPTVGPLTVSV